MSIPQQKMKASSRQARAYETLKRRREAAAALRAGEREARRKRAERVQLASQTSDGLAPAFRARLHDAANRALNDPRAKAALAAAELAKRVRDTRAHHGLTAAVAPITQAKPLAPEEVPASLADLRRAKRSADTREGEPSERQSSGSVRRVSARKDRA